MAWKSSHDPSNRYPTTVRDGHGRRVLLGEYVSGIDDSSSRISYCVDCGVEFLDDGGYTKCEICRRFSPRAGH